MPYQMNAEEFERHKHMMEYPADWPLWPILPVKRSPDQNPNTGVMVAVDGRKFDVYICNMFDLKDGLIGHQLDKFDKETYKDIEGILDAGWRVD